MDFLSLTDLIIGAVLIPGAKAPKLITKYMLSRCKKGAVLVDISIDQGGIAETSKATTLKDPSYSKMPAMVPRTASIALSNRTLPYLLTLGKNSISQILETKNDLGRSLVCNKGVLANQHIAEAFGVEWKSVVKFSIPDKFQTLA